MGLPCVNHFVDDRLKDLKKRDDGKVGRIDSNFIRRSLVDGMDETPVREIAVSAFFPLHCDQTMRQLIPE